MDAEIMEVIKKQLPAQVGEVLRTRLAEADQLQKDLDSSKRKVTDLQNQIALLSNDIQNYKKHDERNANLDTREKAITEREIKRDVSEANLKAAESEKRATELAGIVQLVFKSPIYRKSYVNDLFNGYSDQGQHQTTGGIPQSVEESED